MVVVWIYVWVRKLLYGCECEREDARSHYLLDELYKTLGILKKNLPKAAAIPA